MARANPGVLRQPAPIVLFLGFGESSLDFELRANVGDGRVYLGGLVGPRLMFDGGFPIRFHGAFEFGLNTGSLSFGLELGYLTNSPIAGLRLSFRI